MKFLKPGKLQLPKGLNQIPVKFRCDAQKRLRHHRGVAGDQFRLALGRACPKTAVSRSHQPASQFRCTQPTTACSHTHTAATWLCGMTTWQDHNVHGCQTLPPHLACVLITALAGTITIPAAIIVLASYLEIQVDKQDASKPQQSHHMLLSQPDNHKLHSLGPTATSEKASQCPKASQQKKHSKIRTCVGESC